MAQISLFATRSLKSIDEWMTTCQGNLSDTSRVAFKENSLWYGGGPVNIITAPGLITQGKMIGEQTLTTANTRLNWRQGDLVSSTQDTHFAIQGEGFFLVTDPRRVVSYDGNTTVSAQAQSDQNLGSFVTRDGEFHFSVVSGVAGGKPILVTKEGFIVQADKAGSAPGPTGTGNSDNNFSFITFDDFYADDTPADPTTTPPTPALNNQVRPSIVLLSTDAYGPGAIVGAVENNDLKFSQYGSTIYQIEANHSVKTIVNGSRLNFDRRDRGNFPFAVAPDIPSADSGAMLIDKALESSNVDVAMNITEMAALGKMYNGFVQLIKVYNGSLDEVLAFIR